MGPCRDLDQAGLAATRCTFIITTKYSDVQEPRAFFCVVHLPRILKHPWSQPCWSAGWHSLLVLYIWQRENVNLSRNLLKKESGCGPQRPPVVHHGRAQRRTSPAPKLLFVMCHILIKFEQHCMSRPIASGSASQVGCFAHAELQFARPDSGCFGGCARIFHACKLLQAPAWKASGRSYSAGTLRRKAAWMLQSCS